MALARLTKIECLTIVVAALVVMLMCGDGFAQRGGGGGGGRGGAGGPGSGGRQVDRPRGDRPGGDRPGFRRGDEGPPEGGPRDGGRRPDGPRGPGGGEGNGLQRRRMQPVDPETLSNEEVLETIEFLQRVRPDESGRLLEAFKKRDQSPHVRRIVAKAVPFVREMKQLEARDPELFEQRLGEVRIFHRVKSLRMRLYHARRTKNRSEEESIRAELREVLKERAQIHRAAKEKELEEFERRIENIRKDMEEELANLDERIEREIEHMATNPPFPRGEATDLGEGPLRRRARDGDADRPIDRDRPRDGDFTPRRPPGDEGEFLGEGRPERDPDPGIN